jgi:hypothetical protein
MTDAFRQVILRELGTLARELGAYPDEQQIWTPVAGLPNTAGTLALHLVGNLEHFIGAVLGHTGYVRDRDAEFARRDVPRAELLALVPRTRGVVAASLAALDDAALDAPFPVPLAGKVLPTRLVLVHLAAHLAYHLGQLDAHRRVVTGQASGVNALALAELQ